MSPQNLYHPVTKIIGFLPILCVSLVALVFGVVSTDRLAGHEIHLSDASIVKFGALNYKHKIAFVDDLLDDKNGIMRSDLFNANLFFQPEESVGDNKGLIVTIDGDKSGDGVLLLEPAVAMTDDELDRVAKEYMDAIPEFDSVEPDQDVNLEGSPMYKLTPDVVRKEVSNDEKPYKNPVRVAVIDSGLDMTHEFFPPYIVESGWNTLDDSSNIYDDVGHGTHIAGIIRQRAPNALIIPYKIVDRDGGRLSNVVQAFDKAITTKVDVINTSFGVLSPSNALEYMMQKAEEKNIIVISAAGNLNTSDAFYPASFTYSIAVAGVDNVGEKMTKSNFGDWIDVASYGNYIWSSLPGNNYGHKSGTSQATAYVTGAVLRILEEFGPMSADKVLEKLNSEGSEILTGQLAGVKIVK